MSATLIKSTLQNVGVVIVGLGVAYRDEWRRYKRRVRRWL